MKYWKAGCNWASRNNPDYYPLVEKHNIIFWDKENEPEAGDIVAICSLNKIKAVAKVQGIQKAITSNDLADLRKEAKEYEIEIKDDNVIIGIKDLKELPQPIEYVCQKGFCQIQKPEIIRELEKYIK